MGFWHMEAGKIADAEEPLRPTGFTGRRDCLSTRLCLCLGRAEKFDSKKLEQLRAKHHDDRERDHAESGPAKRIVDSRVPKLAGQTRIVNEEQHEDKDDRQQDAVQRLNPKKQLDDWQVRDERGRRATDNQRREETEE